MRIKSILIVLILMCLTHTTIGTLELQNHGYLNLTFPFTFKWIEPPQFELPSQYTTLVQYYCTEQNIPVWAFCRMISHESNWKSNAFHRNKDSEDLGIAQINSKNLVGFRIYNDGNNFDAMNADIALKISIRHLGDLQKHLGSLPKALAAYNCGTYKVIHGIIPKSTYKYVMRILGSYQAQELTKLVKWS